MDVIDKGRTDDRRGKTLLRGLRCLLVVVVALGALGVSGAAAGTSATRPIAPARGAPRHTTVLFYGDSVALTLGLALGDYTQEAHDPITLINDGQLGCGIAEGTWVQADGASIGLPADCNVDSPAADQWPALISRQVDRYRPDVVMLLAGRWEAFDRPDASGGLTNITRPGCAASVVAQLQRFVTIASRRGARVVLMTAPYYRPPAGPLGPEDDPARVDAYNRLVRTVVRANPKTTSLFRLNALVSPQGRFALTVDGQVVRATDGIHFPFYSLSDPTGADPDNLFQVLAFSRWIGPKALPFMVDGR